MLFGDGRRVGGIEHGSQCLDYELGLEIPFGRGLRNLEGVPNCDFEHERDFWKDEAGYRGGTRQVHGYRCGCCVLLCNAMQKWGQRRRRKAKMGVE